MRILVLIPFLLAGCATSPADQRQMLNVTLTGVQQVPGPGDPDGTGTAEIRVDPRSGRLCWDLYARQIEPATAAAIYRGAAGSVGPRVVTLATPGADGRSQGCQAIAQDLAREMARQPFAFYLNVHDSAFPDGAIRGQLRGAILRRPRASGR